MRLQSQTKFTFAAHRVASVMLLAALCAGIPAVAQTVVPAPSYRTPLQTMTGHIRKVAASVITISPVPGTSLRMTGRTAVPVSIKGPVQIVTDPKTHILGFGHGPIALSDLKTGDMLMATGTIDATGKLFHARVLFVVHPVTYDRNALPADPRDADFSPVNPAIP